MRCTTLYNKVLSHRGNFLLMLQNFRPRQMEVHPLQGKWIPNAIWDSDSYRKMIPGKANKFLRSHLLTLLIVLRCYSFLGGFCISVSYVTISSNVSLTILEDPSVGFWFLVQISWFFKKLNPRIASQWSTWKLCVLSPWITYFNYFNGAQLRKFFQY